MCNKWACGVNAVCVRRGRGVHDAHDVRHAGVHHNEGVRERGAHHAWHVTRERACARSCMTRAACNTVGSSTVAEGPKEPHAEHDDVQSHVPPLPDDTTSC